MIEIERKKEENISLNVKICFNKDTLGGSEPTQYSQCFVSHNSNFKWPRWKQNIKQNLFNCLKTKTVQVKSSETAQELVNRCKHLFNLDTLDCSTQTSTLQASNSYQLWLKTTKNEPLIPLIGKNSFLYLLTNHSFHSILKEITSCLLKTFGENLVKLYTW